MRLARHVENDDTWQKVCRSGNAQTPRHGSPKGTGKGSGKSSRKSKSTSKKRTPESCLSCGKEGHKKADCKFKTATCSNCGLVGHLRAVCRNTNNTHEMEKDADEPSPEVTVETVWCDTVDDGHCDCIEKHDVNSEHRANRSSQNPQNVVVNQNSELSSRTSRRVKIRKCGDVDRDG